MQDPAPQVKPNWVRRGLVFLLILTLGLALYFAGKFIYSFGQLTAARLSSADSTVSRTPLPTLPATATGTATIIPTPTTDYFPPTATATRIPWTSCPGVVVTVTDTDKGDIVHVLRCEDGFEYDIGPLTKGVYAVSPNDKYIVYCDLNGIIYAARIGDATLTVIMKAKREFFVFGRDVDPLFELTFSGESPYVLEVYEKRYAQNLPINMPRWLSDD